MKWANQLSSVTLVRFRLLNPPPPFIIVIYGYTSPEKDTATQKGRQIQWVILYHLHNNFYPFACNRSHQNQHLTLFWSQRSMNRLLQFGWDEEIKSVHIDCVSLEIESAVQLTISYMQVFFCINWYPTTAIVWQKHVNFINCIIYIFFWEKKRSDCEQQKRKDGFPLGWNGRRLG